MKVNIGCVVEGKGEVKALPILIRRIAAMHCPEIFPVVSTPIRFSRNKVSKPGELEYAVGIAVKSISRQGAILILLDSDDDCPAQLAPTLLARILPVFRNIPIAVVFAKHEFESWFLAAAESLRGKRGLRTDINSPDNPETIRGAKEWLRRRMQSGKTYSVTTRPTRTRSTF